MTARRSNPFLSRPPVGVYSGRTMSGVQSHPGFHTSQNIDIVMPYAQAKVAPNWQDDYPVILGFDMEGLEFFADYDVEKAFEDVYDAFRYYSNDSFASLDNFLETAEALADYEFDSAHFPVYRLSSGASGESILFARASAFDKPDWKFAQYVLELDEEQQQEAFVGLRDRALSTELLADALEQRRYLQDVGDDRLKVILYMQPVWELMQTPYDEHNEEAFNAVVTNLEENGFTVYTTGDIEEGGGELPPPRLEVAWGKDKNGLQYHGTSYRNLLRAAPHLKRRLPTPPSPFGRDVDFAEEAVAAAVAALERSDISYEEGSGVVRLELAEED